MRYFLIAFAIIITNIISAQDATTLMAAGKKLEQQLKDSAALEKYLQAFTIQPSNINAAIKCAEMNCSIGFRQTDDNTKKRFYITAKQFADTALKLNIDNAEANYAMALVYNKLMTIEKSNEKFVEDLKNFRSYAEQSLTINPNFGKAWHLMGKWHYEVLNLNPVKKAALKVLYGNIPKASIEEALAAFEKCKTLEPYLVRNYFDMAKSYYYDKQYEKALSALQQCIKCPTFLPEDLVMKQEAKKLLVEWQ